MKFGCPGRRQCP